MYEYAAKLDRIIDGDTITIDIDCGFGIWKIDEVVRLYGINCPELPSEAGIAAKDFVQRWKAENGPVCIVQTVKDKREKYGRLLATIHAGLRCLNDDLVTNGHAVRKVY